ncbi:alpha/beta hydrolase family protein [Pectinatus brassicae]|uniref:Pimeloyl-ACP methyl ester carboxylesterase n=1 Tax=Pectinatus brassicae TaxID=862415 RepID=A0A840UJL2_9FIRM|nr:alpha/beta fold hydrolase [Pectinatus brassicae]MBB5337336.1 pimeloyl-ACP methyl ester carboxylesterase [Pectinatus brassicae]
MKKWFIVAILLIFIGSCIGYYFNTAGGDIAVKDVRFAGKDGKILSGLLYIPSNAANATPAPAVLGMHGYINSRETQDAFAIEFARRGYVFLAMDMTGHGYSDQILGDGSRGVEDGIKYIRNLPFVDHNNIGLEGHSMGGYSTSDAAVRNQDKINTLILVSSASEMRGGPQITGDAKFNFAVVFGERDEFTRFMYGVNRARDIGSVAKLKVAFNTTDDVVLGKLYGSFADKTARQWFMPSATHPGAHLSKEAIGDVIQFMQGSIAPPRRLDSGDQIWQWKEFGNALIFIGLIVFMGTIARWLIHLSYFKDLIHPMPATNAKMNANWWIGALIGTVIPAASLFKFQNWGNGWIPHNWFWPQAMTNGVVVWDLMNGLIGLVLFAVWYHFIYQADVTRKQTSSNLVNGGQ